MPVLSDDATTICAMMEPGRGYEFAELRKLAPELSADAIREVMRELWIERLVERFGDLGWRRTGRLEAAASAHPSRDAASLRVGAVTPEDLFDHKSFAAWFK